MGRFGLQRKTKTVPQMLFDLYILMKIEPNWGKKTDVQLRLHENWSLGSGRTHIYFSFRKYLALASYNDD